MSQKRYALNELFRTHGNDITPYLHATCSSLSQLLKNPANLSCFGRTRTYLQSALQMLPRVCRISLLLVDHSNMEVVSGIFGRPLERFLQQFLGPAAIDSLFVASPGESIGRPG